MRLMGLQAFRAVMETGTVTRAAGRLRRTQPQISRLIATLEQELGFKLFVRHGRRLAPTAEGQGFYREAQRLLAGIDEISRVAEDIRTQREPRLRLLSQPFLADAVLDDALARFAAVYPGLRYTLEIRSRAVGEWVAGQQFDLGLAALPIDAPAIVARPFGAAAVVAVVPRGHRLARRKAIAAADLAGEPFIALRPHTLLRNLVDSALAPVGVSLDIRAETSSGHSSCRMVARGLGLTLADPLVAASSPQRDIVVRPFRPLIMLTYGWLFPAGQEPSRLAVEFARTVAETARALAPANLRLLDA